MGQIAIIGDVHGILWRYEQLIRHFDQSIQVGDMGFRREYEGLIERVDPEKHKFIPGNHDDYDNLPPHSLGDFGKLPWLDNGFFVRGAWSIDKPYRTPGISWWEAEELNTEQMNQALDAYVEAKPAIMITHTAPASIAIGLADPSWGGYHADATSRLLEAMLNEHSPKLWIFGHWHKSHTEEFRGTTFRCLSELELMVLEDP